MDVALATAGRAINDLDWGFDERNRALKPLIPALVNTASTRKVSRQRAFYLADWCIRAWLPALVRVQRDSVENAAALEVLAEVPELTPETLQQTLKQCKAAPTHGYVVDGLDRLRANDRASSDDAMYYLFKLVRRLHDTAHRSGTGVARRAATRVRREAVKALHDAARCF